MLVNAAYNRGSISHQHSATMMQEADCTMCSLMHTVQQNTLVSTQLSLTSAVVNCLALVPCYNTALLKLS